MRLVVGKRERVNGCVSMRIDQQSQNESKICSALSHLYENYTIYRKEFERALYTMGMRMMEDEYDALFTLVDKDGSGTVVANCCAV